MERVLDAAALCKDNVDMQGKQRIYVDRDAAEVVSIRWGNFVSNHFVAEEI